MAIARTLIQSHSANESSPALIMTRVNNDLSKDNPKSMFVTLIIAVMNIRTGHVRYANAGHNLPIILDREGNCNFVEGISGPVAGAMEGISYKELFIDLRPKDALFIYTDGITEAMNLKQELFSDEKLLLDACQAGTTEVEEFVKNIRERVVKFVDGAPQSDDITMLMLKYNGNK
jgi:phosphoserine phosphatase RsbU/P